MAGEPHEGGSVDMIPKGKILPVMNFACHGELSNKRRRTMSMKTMVVMAVGVALLGMSTLVQAGEMKARLKLPQVR